MLLTVLRDVFIVNDETIFIAQINFKNDLPFSVVPVILSTSRGLHSTSRYRTAWGEAFYEGTILN